jgi:tRNA (cytidine/uridine-2'-O-)-methyltransferase
MTSVALYQPEIPQNVGTIMRLCACFDAALHIIEPVGFIWNDKKLKRSHMDYFPNIKRYLSFEEFDPSHRLLLLDTKGETSCWGFDFREHDILLLGKESTGVPDSVKAKCNHTIFIPMNKNCRSLNVAVAASIVLAEAKRQLIQKKERSKEHEI